MSQQTCGCCGSDLGEIDWDTGLCECGALVEPGPLPETPAPRDVLSPAQYREILQVFDAGDPAATVWVNGVEHAGTQSSNRYHDVPDCSHLPDVPDDADEADVHRDKTRAYIHRTRKAPCKECVIDGVDHDYLIRRGLVRLGCTDADMSVSTAELVDAVETALEPRGAVIEQLTNLDDDAERALAREHEWTFCRPGPGVDGDDVDGNGQVHVTKLTGGGRAHATLCGTLDNARVVSPDLTLRQWPRQMCEACRDRATAEGWTIVVAPPDAGDEARALFVDAGAQGATDGGDTPADTIRDAADDLTEAAARLDGVADQSVARLEDLAAEVRAFARGLDGHETDGGQFHAAADDRNDDGHDVVDDNGGGAA